MKLLNFFLPKDNTVPKTSKFSDFFLNTSEKKKIEILNEAARKANKDQREIVDKASLKSKI
jgi:hypothetical protein